MSVENLILFICSHADSAHWIIFLMLMLAGLNIPISEDILLLIGGIIASTCIPENALYLYAWIYAGCWISAWEAYWVGRLLGPKLYTVRIFKHIINPTRVEKLHYYYEKFGIFTFIVGRFIPGGVRNALFMSSGLGKMPFLTFILRDGVACLISSAVIFRIGYAFGENYAVIIDIFKQYQFIGLIIFCLLLLFGIAYTWYKHRQTTD